MADELKSAWQIAEEKARKMGGEDVPTLNAEQRDEIAEIRKVYKAKMAEVEILVTEKEKKDIDLDRLVRERDRKIEAVYQKAKGKKQ
ncbi:MAG TPA: hypothetical protein VLS90_05235 [Thermodesulfobacteriota bacterium]|nr:hypothetical protein [Thermodesulfobacteriota bacterium]